jgi:rRNA maturation endonuclease Nob1
MSREDSRETNPVTDSDSQMLRCVACNQLFPARNDKLVPAAADGGGRCSECGGGEFEQVVLNPDPRDRD